MHGVALPDGEVAGALDGGYVGGKVLADLAGAVAGDQGYLADFAVGVDDVEKADELATLLEPAFTERGFPVFAINTAK